MSPKSASDLLATSRGAHRPVGLAPAARCEKWRSWTPPHTYWIRVFVLPRPPGDLLAHCLTWKHWLISLAHKRSHRLSLGLSFPNCRMQTASASVRSQGCCADQKTGGMWKGIVNCTVLYKGQNQTVNHSIKALETIRQTDNAFYLPGPGWAGTLRAVCYAK